MRVFVHGVPETAVIWEPLVTALGPEDVTLLSPPGFGAPPAEGFDPTLDGYRDWLIGELERFEAPVDLVGHDFGGAHTVAVAMSRPDLLRSWVSDAVGVFEPGYEWHRLAQVWQTPGEGERAIEKLIGASGGDRAATMTRWGIPEPAASAVAAGQDEAMGRAILALYRSAVQPALAERGRDLAAAAARPGLAVIATGDDLGGSTELRVQAAARAGATTATLEGASHWWMLEDPAGAARMLTAFWAD